MPYKFKDGDIVEVYKYPVKYDNIGLKGYVGPVYRSGVSKYTYYVELNGWRRHLLPGEIRKVEEPEELWV